MRKSNAGPVRSQAGSALLSEMIFGPSTLDFFDVVEFGILPEKLNSLLVIGFRCFRSGWVASEKVPLAFTGDIRFPQSRWLIPTHSDISRCVRALAASLPRSAPPLHALRVFPAILKDLHHLFPSFWVLPAFPHLLTFHLTHALAKLGILPQFCQGFPQFLPLPALPHALDHVRAKVRVLPTLLHLPAHYLVHACAVLRVLPLLFRLLAHACAELGVLPQRCHRLPQITVLPALPLLLALHFSHPCAQLGVLPALIHLPAHSLTHVRTQFP